MIFKHIFGVIDFKATGDNSLKLLNSIRKSDFICKNAYVKDNELHGRIYGNRINEITMLAQKNYMDIEIIKKSGLRYLLAKYKKRFGIAFGIVFSLALILFLSNTILKINITGCEDELGNKVLAVLETYGVSPRKFIPSLNFDEIEREIIDSLDNVSWASVRSSGGIITVNIHESTPKPYMVPTRLPSNIVSTKDAQIIDAQVYNGQLMVLKNEGVKKGDILVSGFVTDNKGQVTYYHSQAKIIGEYTEKITFEQKLIDTIKVESNKSYDRNYINFFSLRIPAFIGKNINEECIYTENTNYLSFFSLKLPIGITHKQYTPYVNKTEVYTSDQAKELVQNKISIYEKNFLTGCKIIDKQIIDNSTNEKIVITVEYKVQGSITSDKEILVKK